MAGGVSGKACTKHCTFPQHLSDSRELQPGFETVTAVDHVVGIPVTGRISLVLDHEVRTGGERKGGAKRKRAPIPFSPSVQSLQRTEPSVPVLDRHNV